MKLDPSFWDRLTKDQRYQVLKGCLLMARAGVWNQRDYTKPRDYSKLAIPAETVTETGDRIREAWEQAGVTRARAVARKFLGLDGGKR